VRTATVNPLQQAVDGVIAARKLPRNLSNFGTKQKKNHRERSERDMAALVKWYRHSSQHYPIRTNLVQTGEYSTFMFSLLCNIEISTLTRGRVNGCCVSGFMFGLGDMIAQSAVEKREVGEIDWLRTVRYASIGCAVGPTLSMWYRTLDRFGTKNTVPVLAKKLLVDQLIASPIINGSVMTMSRVFSGDEWPQIRKKLEDNYVTVMLNSYLVKLLGVLFYFVFLIKQFCTALAGRTSCQLHTRSAAVQGFDGTNNIVGLEYICFIYECWRRKRVVQRSIINLQNLNIYKDY